MPVQQLPSPPPSPEPELLFARDIDQAQLPAVLETLNQDILSTSPQAGLLSNDPQSEASESTTEARFVRRRPRIGRGGRLIFDR